MTLFPASGRSGLDQIDVTPAVFLQLRAQLAAGKNLPFTEPQLLIAFSRYLHDNKGQWTRSQIKGTRELHKFAEEYVAHQTHKLENKFGPNGKRPTTKKQVSNQQKKAENFLERRGLKLLDKKDIPQAEGMPSEKYASLVSKQTVKRTVDAGEVVAELFSVARAADPATAVAAILLSRTLLPNMSSMAIDGTHLLIEKFEKRSKTKEEKDLVLHGLEIVTARLSPLHFSKEMARIQEMEKNNPHGVPDYLKRMEKMRGGSESEARHIALEKEIEQEAEQKAAEETAQDVLKLYQESLTELALEPQQHNAAARAVAYEYETPQHVSAAQHPFGGAWDLSKGPKPPTDEIFGLKQNDDDDDEGQKS